MTDTNELREELDKIDKHIKTKSYREITDDTTITEMRLKLSQAVIDEIMELITAQTQAAYNQGYIDGGIEQINKADKKG